MKECTKKLETQRLVLRKFVLEDYKAMYDNWASDENVSKSAGWPKHNSSEETKELVSFWVNEYNEDNVFNWVIELKDKFPIGSITVVKKDLNNKTCELGFNIGRKYWNNGYASEALKAVIEYLFSLDLFDTLIAEVFAFNEASIKVLEKSGFSKEGTLRDRYIINGEKTSLIVLSLLKEEYDN